MARRTIRAQRSSPYLVAMVVVLAVLFVAAAIGWGWTWNKRNEELANTFGLDRLEQAAKADQDPFTMFLKTKYQELGKNYADVVDNLSKQSDEFRSEIPRLIRQINGETAANLPPQQLRQAVSDTLKLSSTELDEMAKSLQNSFAGQPGAEAQANVKVTYLVPAVRDLRMRVDALTRQVKDDTQANLKLQGQVDGLNASLDSTRKDNTQEVAQLQESMKAERTSLSVARDNAIAVQQQLEVALKQAIDRHMADKKAFLTESEKFKNRESTLTNTLKQVSHEVQEYRKIPTEQAVDGHIIRLSEAENVAYGDLGKRDGILLGLTFAIFGQGELGKPQPEPKAQCRVVKIMDDACELRVEQIRKDSPVVTGDLLINPVYSRTQRLSFYLVGRMTFEPGGTDNGEQIKSLIQRSGGRIETTLTHQVDYLIMGEQPAVPAAPGSAASPMERQAYERSLKSFVDYAESRTKAEQFGIPIYSLNRFMSLMGMAGQQ
jgi:hypothetical protein